MTDAENVPAGTVNATPDFIKERETLAYADGWREAVDAVQKAADDGTLVDRFLNGKRPLGYLPEL